MSDTWDAAGDTAGALATLPPVADYALRLGDDALVLAQRLAEWVARAPQIEEDVALANIALDLLGQARALLCYAGAVEGAGRGEDDLAFGRRDREFRNVQLVEIDNGDFAVTMARQLAFSTYQVELYAALQRSSDPTLAGLAGKAVKEVRYHREHAALWVVRLGDGTDESARRMQAGLAAVWPYLEELFEVDPLLAGLVADGVAVDAAGLRPEWERFVDGVLAQAALERPAATWRARGGRRGLHTEAMSYLLAEMQSVARAFPGASW